MTIRSQSSAAVLPVFCKRHLIAIFVGADVTAVFFLGITRYIHQRLAGVNPSHGRAERKNVTRKESGNGANLGFEQKLWQAADKLRGHMDSAEYKHVVLGLIFLKYISDAFQERYETLKKEPHADPEDRDEYTAENIFWVPKKARWSSLQANAKQYKEVRCAWANERNRNEKASDDSCRKISS